MDGELLLIVTCIRFNIDGGLLSIGETGVPVESKFGL